MSWKESLSVDVVSIDREHQMIVQAMETLFANMHQGMSQAEMLDEIDCLVETVAAHFGHEERVMRNIRMDGYQAHCLLHRSLLEEIRQFRTEVVGGANGATVEATEQFLRFWLYRHITAEDLKIAHHLNR